MTSVEDGILRAHIEGRIRELWAFRAWYRDHLGWIPASKAEHDRELRYLVGLLRTVRRIAAREGRDAIEFAKWEADRCSHWTAA